MAKILIVDDSEIVRSIVAGWLQAAGHIVATIDGPASFVRAAKAEKPDLILMDIDMPGLPGMKLTKLATTEGMADCPIVLHSSRSANDLASYCLHCGAVGYIEKTSDSGLFVRKVAEFINRKFPGKT